MNLAGFFLLFFPRSRGLKATGLAVVMLLTACGFQMRGETPLPFKTLYVGIPDNTRFGADVRRSIRAVSPETRIVADPKAAAANLQQVSSTRSLRDVALNAQGRVEEYELGLVFTFRLVDSTGRAIIPDTTFTVYRDLPYDDGVVQAKQSQMEALYESMQQTLLSRLLRRLTAPDVAESMHRLEQTKDDISEDTPLFDPNVRTDQRQGPALWNTPNITPGRGAQPE
ncbi:LPS assembly lipoprotein LptE [Bordetella holmesii]|uniref:LPS-assembly lipoprotein LptE n=2 Tax=Bordetella holmesii TaxID=35814 RepID=A0A158MAP1_9BORD|nr:LPS assembly lipoprotein LptE [Bordetella holmesii]EWM46014.1 lipopolysaccharide-assembly family protein [Bordetella holmesii 70147]EWM48724.1 lipopolysaccharide-assembly family protein [Bordetella holmesii 41130]EWM50148.1 lipopolysaccharide-assembly family protein [Bordetella holmesii 35009]AMD44637.1 hypothetical protein H558_03455 [Bordetella holmesii H558]AMD49882.1 hypothetical protein F783_014630 [Bordetella holmesii F627]